MNDLPDEKLALGCYGSPLIYDPAHQVCSTCPHRAPCGPKASARLAVLHAHYGIRPKTAVTPAAAPINGVRRALTRGMNPLKESEPRRWLRMAFDMLIREDGRLIMDDLINAYVDTLSEDPDAAVWLARRAVELMDSLGAIVVAGGRISIRRE